MTTKKVNDEFDLDGIDGLAEKPKAKVTPAKKTAKKAAPSKAEPEVVEAERVVLDPEDDRENWPTIHVDSEEGKPNYEYLAAHGTKKNGSSFGHELQVMRGVDVKVPPSIVYNLQDAVSAHFSPSRDPLTGKNNLIRTNRSSIPWRLIKGGKYI